MAHTPTHTVPGGGLPAWSEPDPSRPPVTTLAEGLAVQLHEWRGQWARVEASNGWTGWVDGMRLVALTTAPTPATPAQVAPTRPPGRTQRTAEGPPGRTRGIGVSILLFVVTFGIYGLVWYFQNFRDLRTHNGTGVGAGLGLVLAFTGGAPFVMAHEIGQTYELDGRSPPVRWTSGFWMLIPVLGGLIWYLSVQGALNDYWVSKGASPP